jgi:hypothetical protein
MTPRDVFLFGCLKGELPDFGCGTQQNLQMATSAIPSGIGTLTLSRSLCRQRDGSIE